MSKSLRSGAQRQKKRQATLLQHFASPPAAAGAAEEEAAAAGKERDPKRPRHSPKAKKKSRVPWPPKEHINATESCRSILDALKPQKASSFVPPARYRDGPKDAWHAIAKDEDIEKLCPMTLIRDVLPSAVAAKLLHQLEEESETWARGKWIVFGKEHQIPRKTASYYLTKSGSTTATATDTHTEDQGTAMHKNDKDYNYNEDDEDDEYRDEQRPISSELREAARCVAEHVQKHCPWAAMNQTEGWEPSFAFANRYANGQDNVGWHSDHITPLGPRPIIAGLTLGACRRFDLRQQPQQQKQNSKTTAKPSSDAGASKCRHLSIPLPHNSLCIMWNDAQEAYQHSVPKCSDDALLNHAKVGPVRISLTFRKKRNIPDLGNCYCGRPAALRAKDGNYYLFCRPYGKDKHKTCHFWKPCAWAEEEAKNLKAQERATKRSSDLNTKCLT